MLSSVVGLWQGSTSQRKLWQRRPTLPDPTFSHFIVFQYPMCSGPGIQHLSPWRTFKIETIAINNQASYYQDRWGLCQEGRVLQKPSWWVSKKWYLRWESSEGEDRRKAITVAGKCTFLPRTYIKGVHMGGNKKIDVARTQRRGHHVRKWSSMREQGAHNSQPWKSKGQLSYLPPVSQRPHCLASRESSFSSDKHGNVNPSHWS